MTTITTITSHRNTRPSLEAEWVLHIDGATLGSNPSSVGGAGLTVWADSKLYYAQHCAMVGSSTNNSAEFFALVHALGWAQKSAHLTPLIRTDSDIVYRWADGQSTLNDPRLLLLAQQCRDFRLFLDYKVEWVGRDSSPQQQLTDYIAKLGCGGDGKYQTLESHKALIHSYYRRNP